MILPDASVPLKAKRASIFRHLPDSSLHLVWKWNDPSPGRILKVRNKIACVLGLPEDPRLIFH